MYEHSNLKHLTYAFLWACFFVFDWFIPLALINRYWYLCILAMLASLVLLFLRKALFGYINHMLWFGKDQGVIKPGFYVVFNFFPLTGGLNGFGGEIALTEDGKRVYDDAPVHHFRDQRRPSMNLQVHTDSMVKAGMYNTTSNVAHSITDLHAGNREMQHWRFGRVLFFVTIILTALLSVFSYVSHKAQPVVDHVSDAVGIRKEVTVAENLSVGSSVPIPPQRYFVPNKDLTTQYAVDIGGVRYAMYGDVPADKVWGVKVTRGTCVLVPAGREAAIYSTVAPRYVMNMERSVHVTKRLESLTWFDTLNHRVRFPNANDLTIKERMSWKSLPSSWQDVYEENGISVIALPYDNLPDKRVPGGMVCF